MAPATGIYIGWVGRQNLGDEAIWAVCQARFLDVRWSVLDELAHAPSACRFLRRASHEPSYFARTVLEELHHQPRLRSLLGRLSHRCRARLFGETGLLGGGTLVNLDDGWLNAYRTVRRKTRSVVPVLSPGVAAPEFWHGREGWSDRRAEWRDELGHLPIIGVRGPLSKALLDEVGLANVVAVGDPAAALHAAYKGRTRRDPPNPHIRVAINFGDCMGKLWGDPHRLLDVLAAATRTLLSEGHHVSLIAVQPLDVNPCLQLARAAGLPRAAVNTAFSPARFLQYIESFDVLISLKLHAAVLAAAANLPLIVLEYQPKCRDFALSIGWTEFCRRTSELSADWIVATTLGISQQVPMLSDRLCQAMCTLATQFARYCSMVEGLLRPVDPMDI